MERSTPQRILPHPEELDGTPGACPAWYRGNDRGYQKGLEEGKQPWVKIGEGELPEDHRPCWVKDINKDEEEYIGTFDSTLPFHQWFRYKSGQIIYPTHYQLIPKPGTPPDEALEGLEDLDFKELESGTPEDE